MGFPSNCALMFLIKKNSKSNSQHSRIQTSTFYRRKKCIQSQLTNRKLRLSK